jgi:hypothetical protein
MLDAIQLRDAEERGIERGMERGMERGIALGEARGKRNRFSGWDQPGWGSRMRLAGRSSTPSTRWNGWMPY